MKRYIEANALYASIAKDTYVLTDRINSRDYGMYLIGIKKKIDEAPTVDVVEVVRCKDCKYYNKHKTYSSCTYWTGDPYEQASVEDEDFCSYGERRDADV